MQTPDQLLALLSHHIGKGNGIGVKQLAVQLNVEPRQVRLLVSALRDKNHAVCGTPKHGYYIAETPEELRETTDFLIHRAKHSLHLASRLTKIPMADLIGQLHLPT
jgi:hypothetical protein